MARLPAGNDYMAASLAGKPSLLHKPAKSSRLMINGDVMVEANETFAVHATSVAGATVSDGAVGTIYR